MSLHTGVLKNISGGQTKQDIVIREFINIGETHLKKVAVLNYHDEMLLTVVGREITLNVVKRMRLGGYEVVAIKMPDGQIVKESFGTVFSKQFIMSFQVLFIAAIFFGGVFVVGMMVMDSPLNNLNDLRLNPVFYIAAGGLLLCLAVLTASFIKTVRAWKAL